MNAEHWHEIDIKEFICGLHMYPGDRFCFQNRPISRIKISLGAPPLGPVEVTASLLEHLKRAKKDTRRIIDECRS